VQVSFSGNTGSIVTATATATSLQALIPKLNPGVYQVIATNFDGQFSVAPGFLAILGP